MDRSLSVLAADDRSAPVPDCADYWLCRQHYEWLGMGWPAENARVLVATPAQTDAAELITERRTQRARSGEALRLGNKSQGIRTPLPLLAGSAAAGAGVR
jgi:hypothetical protein